MATPLTDFSKLCVHTLTTRPWNLSQCITHYSAAGIKAMTIWRNVIENQDIGEAKHVITDHGMEVVSLARGGFFPSVDQRARQAACWPWSRHRHWELRCWCWYVVARAGSRLKSRGIRYGKELSGFYRMQWLLA